MDGCKNTSFNDYTCTREARGISNRGGFHLLWRLAGIMSQLCSGKNKKVKQNKTNANVIVIISNAYKGRRAQPRADGARETAGAWRTHDVRVPSAGLAWPQSPVHLSSSSQIPAPSEPCSHQVGSTLNPSAWSSSRQWFASRSASVILRGGATWAVATQSLKGNGYKTVDATR